MIPQVHIQSSWCASALFGLLNRALTSHRTILHMCGARYEAGPELCGATGALRLTSTCNAASGSPPTSKPSGQDSSWVYGKPFTQPACCTPLTPPDTHVTQQGRQTAECGGRREGVGGMTECEPCRCMQLAALLILPANLVTRTRVQATRHPSLTAPRIPSDAEQAAA